MYRSLCLEGNEFISDSSKEVVYYNRGKGWKGGVGVTHAMRWLLCRGEREPSHSRQKLCVWRQLGEDTKEPARNLKWLVGAREEGKNQGPAIIGYAQSYGPISWLVENPWKVIPDRLRYVSIRLKCLFKDLGSSKTESCRENTKLCRTFAIFRYLVSYVANPTTAILLFAVFVSSSLSWLCSMFVAFPGRNNPLSVSPTS